MPSTRTPGAARATPHGFPKSPRTILGPRLATAAVYEGAALAIAPFSLPALASQYDTGLSTAAIATAAQLLGVAIGAWAAGRVLTPTATVLRRALIASALTNLAAAALPPLGVLFALRLTAGLTLGVLGWVIWTRAMADEGATNRVAAIGALSGVISAPAASVAVHSGGLAGVYGALVVAAAFPLVFSDRSAGRPTEPSRPRGERHPATKDARRIAVGLGLFTLGGSAVFTYGTVIATRNTGLSGDAIALAYSANSLVGIPAARFAGSRSDPHRWLLVCALMGLVLALPIGGAGFVAAMVVWGFAFWIAVPATFSLLARRSNHPGERAGDAQSLMAIGRVIGPVLGGLAIDAADLEVLGAIGAAFMGAAAILVFLAGRTDAVDLTDQGPAQPGLSWFDDPQTPRGWATRWSAIVAAARPSRRRYRPQHSGLLP